MKKALKQNRNDSVVNIKDDFNSQEKMLSLNLKMGRILFCLLCICGLTLNKGYSQQKQIPLPHPQHLGPSCQFSVLNYCYGDTTYFINQTIRMMGQSWEIADSNGILFSSVDTNIKFLFPSMGTYSVTLRANNGHPDSLIKTIVIDTTTKADFLFQQCTQRLINMSACASNFYWNFGDGNFSTDSLPIHAYSDTGSYVVKLIAYNGTVSDTLTQSIYVYSLGYPTANFTFTQSNDTVYFYGDTAAEYFNWDFGDGTFDTLKNPSHVFPDTGDYNVFLLVTNYCGMYFNSQIVHVSPPASVFNFPGYEDLNIVVSPNPFNEHTIIRFQTPKIINSELTIIDIFGREVSAEIIKKPDSYVIHKGNLPSGIYVARFTSGGKNIGNSKLIIQ